MRNFGFKIFRVLNFTHSGGYTLFKNKLEVKYSFLEVTVSYHLQIHEILVGYEVL
jgi:hypothetical protein